MAMSVHCGAIHNRGAIRNRPADAKGGYLSPMLSPLKVSAALRDRSKDRRATVMRTCLPFVFQIYFGSSP